MTKLLIYWYY